MNKLTSIVICTYNRSGLLRRLLGCLADCNLDPSRFEIVVINDGSTDDTVLICNAFSHRSPNFVAVESKTNQGIAHAANLGATTASGDKLLFTDDDCIPDIYWAERMAAGLDLHPVIAGAISSSLTPYLTLCHNIATCHRFMPHQSAGPVHFLAGANMGVRKSVLARLGGFDSSYRVAQDMEIALRLTGDNYQPYFEPAAVVRHQPGPVTLREMLHYAADHAAVTIRLRQQFRDVLETPRLLESPVMLRLAAPFIAAATVVSIYWAGPLKFRFLSTLPVVFATKLAWCFGAARGLSQVISPDGTDKLA